MCSNEASKAGIYPGMRLTEARAECSDIVWRECNDKLYQQAENNLLKELIACSPRVSVQQPGVFLLDASGLQRLGGENKLCRDILRLVSRCGYVEGQVGIADSGFAALVATRNTTRRWHIVPTGKDKAFLAPLPISHLPVGPDFRILLEDLGIRTMGQLAALSAEALRTRFDEQGQYIHDLVCGIDDSQPSLPPLERKFETAIEIGGPIENLNDTLFLFKSMLDRLSIELKNKMLCAEELLVHFYNDNDMFDERTIQLIRPSNTSKFLVEVIRLTLESKPLMREFTGLRVAVTNYCKESWSQPLIEVNANCLSTAEQDPLQTEAAMLLLQRFRARVGENALVLPVANDAYFAEKAGAWMPVLKSKSMVAGNIEALSDDCDDDVSNSIQPINVRTDYVIKRAGNAGLNSSLVRRKMIPPEPVLARLDAESRPIAITHRDKWYKVTKITAPECLSGHWWESNIRKSFYQALIERENETVLVALTYDAETKNWNIDATFD